MMNAGQFITVFVSTFALIFLSCCEKDKTAIIKSIPEEPCPHVLSVYPDSATVGTRLMISGMEFDINPAKNQILYNSPYLFMADSGTVDMIYTTVPLEAQSGAVTVISGSDTGIVENFTFVKECEDSTVCVVHFNLNSRVTKTSSLLNAGFGITQEWSALVENDTVTVFRKVTSGIMSNSQIFKFKNDQYTELPNLLSAKFILEAEYPTEYEIETGIIKIQDWNLSGIISGRVLIESGFKVDFWYDFSQ